MAALLSNAVTGSLVDISEEDAVEKCLKETETWKWLLSLDASVPGSKNSTNRKAAIKKYLIEVGKNESIVVNRLKSLDTIKSMVLDHYGKNSAAVKRSAGSNKNSKMPLDAPAVEQQDVSVEDEGVPGDAASEIIRLLHCLADDMNTPYLRVATAGFADRQQHDVKMVNMWDFIHGMYHDAENMHFTFVIYLFIYAVRMCFSSPVFIQARKRNAA